MKRFYPASASASARLNPRLHSFVAPATWADWWSRARWDKRNCCAKLNIISSTAVDRSRCVGRQYIWIKKFFFNLIYWSLTKLWNAIRGQSVSAWSSYPLRSSAAALIYVSPGPRAWQTSSDLSCVHFLHRPKPRHIQKKLTKNNNNKKRPKQSMKKCKKCHEANVLHPPPHAFEFIIP